MKKFKAIVLAIVMALMMVIPIQAATISDSDANILCKIAMAEAEDQGVKGMALVMNVVMNRVNSKAWPNTVEGVVFQKGQFTPVSNGRYYKMTPSAASKEALQWVRNGWDESQGAMYFCANGSSAWHANNLTYLFTYKGHTFYK